MSTIQTETAKPARASLLYDPKIRGYAYQLGLLAVVGFLLYSAADNAITKEEAIRSVASGDGRVDVVSDLTVAEAAAFSGGAVYMNFLDDEGEGRVRAAYGINYARLAQVKQTYDPTNLFRRNHNILPSGEASVRR